MKVHAEMKGSNGKEVVAIVPMPSAVVGVSVEDIRHTISIFPKLFCELTMAWIANGTRARCRRLYNTVASRVPS